MEGLDRGRGPGRLAQRIGRIQHDDVELLPPHEVDNVDELLRRFDGEAVSRQEELGQPKELVVAGSQENANRPRRRRGGRHIARANGTRGGNWPAVNRPRSPGQSVARPQPSAFGLAGGELDDITRATTHGGAKGPEVLDDLDHDLVGIDEGDVDRKEHEGRVNRPARTHDNPIPGRQRTAA
jgi:hypothetical protein